MLMKKIFALLLAALSVAFVACGDENTETRNDWFLTPEASADGTTVELTCLTRFGDGVLEGLDAGFSCAAVSGAESGQFVDYTDVTVDGNRLSARVSGLQPKTLYVFYAYADLPTGRTRSGGASFETGESSGPGPDPDPDTDLTKYTGWAELPAIQKRPDDYYYAAHYCDGEPGGRNYSVCYSKDMRCGMWSAFPLHECYRGDQDRTKKWYYDPIIPQAVQPDLIERSYKPQAAGYSKGHLLASNDRTASYGINVQTFYVTNVAPQWQDSFNGGVWQSLEEDCWKNICADTLYVVSGVFFANDNTTVTDQSDDVCIVPTNFYRVLMRSKSGNTGKPLWELTADEIKCVGFWFENRAYPSGKPSANATSVADIEQKVGFKFFPNVPQAPKNNPYNKSDWTFR